MALNSMGMANVPRHQSLKGQTQGVEGEETKLMGKIWSGDSVILSLRGGGASRLRKQARKRKFKQLALNNHDTGQQCASEFEGGKTIRLLKSLHLDEVFSKPKLGDDPTRTPELREMSEKTSEVEPPAHKSSFKKSSRFIIFIGSFPIGLYLVLEADDLILGNLPFSATEDSIKKHFTKVKPSSIRHSTIKDTGKSKGFAFIEFEDYDRMQTCLKLYHHSSFEDGESAPRKLNVELT